VANKSWAVMVGEYTALAFLLPASALVGWLIGGLLDKAFHTTWLSLPFLILGIVAGFVELIRKLRRDTRHDGKP
jgi:F0F1-type ATP synthase assembly protein I